MMDAPAFAGAGSGGKGFFVEDPKNLKGALAEAMNHRGPALVNIVLSQGSARKPQQLADITDQLRRLRRNWSLDSGVHERAAAQEAAARSF